MISDFMYFKFVAINKKDIGINRISELLKTNVRYQHLKQIAESVLYIPITISTVERSSSAIDRVMPKLRNRLGQET